ncbi:hypothetical protein [Planctomycetes bacterium K23_9]|uniref:Zinc-ribbon domain-containing protein n=1 Tax=Stieleria marina TaxID=1930275 RepID=A0A517NWZ9_9BACT|nr:hypothetical protein K239x_36410 [Planctomycetes bacterium K23_9]
MANQPADLCARCRQPLPADSGYCMDCGFNNTDLVAKSYGVHQQADRRIERAKMLSKLFRFIRWSNWLR